MALLTFYHLFKKNKTKTRLAIKPILMETFLKKKKNYLSLRPPKKHNAGSVASQSTVYPPNCRAMEAREWMVQKLKAITDLSMTKKK